MTPLPHPPAEIQKIEAWPLKQHKGSLHHLLNHQAAGTHLPADVIRLAGVLQIQAVGLLPLLVGAHRHDGLPSPLGAGDVPAGAEEHPVAMLGRDLVEELPEGLVAFAPVADIVGHAGGARRDVRGPVLLTGVV